MSEDLPLVERLDRMERVIAALADNVIEKQREEEKHSQKGQTVQDLFIADFLQDHDEQGGNETVEIFEFMRNNAIPMTDNQVRSFLLLNEFGLSDLADFTYNARRSTVPVSYYYKMMDKLTLADRIKGNAKLSHLLKANANPANTALNPKELQAQGMSRKEIDR